MEAMKCDKCGTYYDRYGGNNQANTIYIQNKNVVQHQECDKSYDLCPRCLKKIQDWLENDIGGAE
jgi:hypothetical protein